MVTYDDLRVWERLLQSQIGVLAGIQAGGRIGIVRRDEAAGSGGGMIVWYRDDDGFRTLRETFRGFRNSDVDVVFVIDDPTLVQLCGEEQRDPIRELRLGIRKGTVLLYFLRTKRELRRLGYEDFVELVGVPLGGCQ